MLSRLAGTIVFLLVMAGGSHSLPAQSDSNTSPTFDVEDAEQKWFGTIETGGPKLRMMVEASLREDGGFDAVVFSLDQGNAKIPIERFALNDGKLEMDVPQVAGSYIGQLDESATAAEGTWTQGGRDMPLNLRRVTEVPQVEVKATWKGTLATGQIDLEVQFRIVQGEDGKDEVLFDSLTQRANNIGATMEATEDGINFEVPAARGRFAGKFNDDKTVLEGTWSQAGNELPLKLERSETPDQAALPRHRPQEPQPPLPYEVESVAFQNLCDEITLAGTLTLPIGDGPFPAVVLVSGSGPQDRDEAIVGHRPFLIIADQLTRKRIAVLRFDDRGVGESEGHFASATTIDFSRDAEAAVRFLGKDARIDPTRIGVVGHSEGGIIAAMLAARLDSLAHIVMLAGTGVPGDQVILSQVAAIEEVMGVSRQTEPGAEPESGSLAEVIEAIKTDADQQVVDAAIEAFLEASRQGEISEAGEKAWTKMAELQFRQLTTPWFRFFLQHDPADDLRRARCPVLALNGDKDLQVLVDLNLPAVERALQDSGISEYRCVRLEGLNHLFQTSETGSPSEYGTLEETFSPAALEIMAEWILAH